jgi:hypothetical protein
MRERPELTQVTAIYTRIMKGHWSILECIQTKLATYELHQKIKG